MTIITIFMNILNMSLTASYCIAAVLLLRLLLKRQPKIFSYLLWSVVLFRLLCPFSISSAYSLLRMDTNIVSQEKLAGSHAAAAVWQGKSYPYADAAQGAEAEKDGVTALPRTADEAAQGQTARWQSVLAVCSRIWLAGVILLIAYGIGTAVRFGLFLKKAVPTGDGLYESAGISTALVFGVVRPRIYLPAHLEEQERRYVAAHERVHIARYDYLVKIAAWGAVCLHWFNPLAWLAFALMESDMEMSCDEAVLRRLGTDVRQDYSRALLTLSCAKRTIGGCPLAFGEGKVKSRIRNILSYRKKTFVTAVLAAVLLAAVIVGLSLNPPGGTDQKRTEEQLAFVTEYANANCARDGDALVGLYINEDTAFENVLMLEKTDGAYTFGYSSPWPDEFRFLIEAEVGKDEGKALIWYYAWTSDPHVTVWKEEMEFVKTKDGYRVTGSDLRFLDSISSYEEFMEAYWIAGEYQFTDYVERGFVEAVNAQTEYDEKSGDGTDRNAVYRSPDTAAEWIFNLTGGGSEVSINSIGSAVVKYTFADGSNILIPMYNANYDSATANSADPDTGSAAVGDVWILDLHVWNAGAPD